MQFSPDKIPPAKSPLIEKTIPVIIIHAQAENKTLSARKILYFNSEQFLKRVLTPLYRQPVEMR